MPILCSSEFTLVFILQVGMARVTTEMVTSLKLWITMPCMAPKCKQACCTLFSLTVELHQEGSAPAACAVHRLQEQILPDATPPLG